MPEKKPLPSARNGKTFKARISNNAIYLRTGEYEDGTLGEIFIEMYKEGAGYKSILGCFSICISWLLQYGVPLEKMVEKFQFTRFEPAGIVTGDTHIKMCSSILDYVFRRLAIHYLDRTDLSNVKEATKKLSLPAKTIDVRAPGIEITTIGSGSLALTPYGQKAGLFFTYLKNRNAEEKLNLDFSAFAVMIWNPAQEREETVKLVCKLGYQFYGETLSVGDK